MMPSTTPHYNATWASLDSRPNPTWWAAQKFGVSLHWGVYSVPSYSEVGTTATGPTTGTGALAEWYWHNMGGPSGPDDSKTGQFHRRAYGADFTYQDFAAQWRAELYNDAKDWAELFRECGVKMAVLTSKHHDGFELWPSARAYGWNSVDVGPKRDLVGAFLSAMRGVDIHAGLYHSVFEWFNPLLNGPHPSDYVTEKLIPDLHDLVTKYEPEMLLMDGEWDRPSDFWETRPFLAWLFDSSPVKDTVVIDDRWGSETRGRHGGVYVCENGMFSPFCDGTGAAQGQSHPWLYWATQARSWGLSRTEDDTDYRDASFFVPLLARVVADGGALMLNMGPAADGRVPPMQQSVLRGIGAWLGINGASIYNTSARHSGSRHEITEERASFGAMERGVNFVFGIPAGAGDATTLYLGKADDAAGCQTLCGGVPSCLAFTWHDGSTGAYASMCFGKNVSSWSTAAEAGHVSAVRDFVQVHYTTAADTLNAIVSPYPPGSTLTLPSPVLTSGATTTVRLLGDPAPPANGSLGHWPLHAIGQPGVVIAVPPLPANKLPCEHAFTFSIRGAI